ncbi:cathelicidin antimicrobial peptide-like isoform 2-T2 [Rhinophrynus dorsalis]
MENCVTVWILFCMCVSASCAPVTQSIPSRESPEKTLQRIMTWFNNGLIGNFTFKLWNIEDSSQLGESESPLYIKFSVRETMCLKAENRSADDCPFKSHGTVKICILFAERGAGSE